MQKLYLNKYGFIRWPEEDFSDDGNRFTCFRLTPVGRLRLSKHVSCGEVYLSCRIDGDLPYEIYCALPSYNKAVWGLNGRSLSALTDKDLEDFYSTCLSYEREYEEAEKKLVYPTLEEVKNQCHKIEAKLLCEKVGVEELLRDKVCSLAYHLSDYEWKSLKRDIDGLIKEILKFDPNKYPQTIVGTSRSFGFVKPENSDLTTPSFWYRDIMEICKKHNLI